MKGLGGGPSSKGPVKMPWHARPGLGTLGAESPLALLGLTGLPEASMTL